MVQLWIMQGFFQVTTHCKERRKNLIKTQRDDYWSRKFCCFHHHLAVHDNDFLLLGRTKGVQKISCGVPHYLQKPIQSHHSLSSYHPPRSFSINYLLHQCSCFQEQQLSLAYPNKREDETEVLGQFTAPLPPFNSVLLPQSRNKKRELSVKAVALSWTDLPQNNVVCGLTEVCNNLLSLNLPDSLF